MTPGSHERVLLHLLYPTLPRSRIGPEEETGADGSHVDGVGTGTRVCRVRGPWHPTVQRRQPFARRPRAPIIHRCPYRYPACSSSCRLTTSSLLANEFRVPFASACIDFRRSHAHGHLVPTPSPRYPSALRRAAARFRVDSLYIRRYVDTKTSELAPSSWRQ